MDELMDDKNEFILSIGNHYVIIGFLGFSNFI
jgi:hypothetical protein